MIDMEIPKKTKKEFKEAAITGYPEDDRYPYGLKLNFDQQEVDKVKILQTIQAGVMVEIIAQAKVISVRTDDTKKGRKRHNVEIQIHKIGITNKQFEEADKEAAFKQGVK